MWKILFIAILILTGTDRLAIGDELGKFEDQFKKKRNESPSGQDSIALPPENGKSVPRNCRTTTDCIFSGIFNGVIGGIFDAVINGEKYHLARFP